MMRPHRPGEPPPRRSRLVALLLACATLITLDYHGGADSPVEPARRAMGEVLGPVEEAAASAVRPLSAVPDWFRSRSEMRREIATLAARNSDLEQQVATSGVDRNRLAEYDGLTAAAGTLGQALVPARVIGMGATQTFSRTVTIDAGSEAGVHPDQTVLNADGLVGRVLRVTRTTATVLLVIDAESVVGGRIGESMQLGFLHGRGDIGRSGRLDLELVDDSVVPRKGDVVVTWGSQSGGPYVTGVPVGRVTQVFSSLRQTSQRAVIEPFADFGSLDLVGVVVPSGTTSDRSIVEADGRLR
jgi:rod shape-determining protein MreC